IYDSHHSFTNVVLIVIMRISLKEQFFVFVNGPKTTFRNGNETYGLDGVGKTHRVFTKGNNYIATVVFIGKLHHGFTGVYNPIQIIIRPILLLRLGTAGNRKKQQDT